MIKLKQLLFEAMTPNEAEYIFARYGVRNVSDMSDDDLKKAWKELTKIHHPDKGGEDLAMRYINAAYDVLSKNAHSVRPAYTNMSDYWGRVRTASSPQYVAGAYYAGSINRGGHVSTPGHKFDDVKDAFMWMVEGGQVFVPGVSASGYYKFFKDVGFSKVTIIDHTSSAGDWVFGLFSANKWVVGFQENAYPKGGFNYSFDVNKIADTFKDLMNL